MIHSKFLIGLVVMLSVQNFLTVAEEDNKSLVVVLGDPEVNRSEGKKREREAEIGNFGKFSQSTDIGNIVQEPDKLNELDLWKAPYDIRKTFPYYHAGFDRDGRPVWVFEIGRWNWKKATESGDEVKQNFNKYMDQAIYRMIKSLAERNTTDNPVTNFIMIMDLEEFDLIKVAHVPTVTLFLGLVRKFQPVVDVYLHSALLINTSAAADGILRLSRPILAHVMERVEVFGTNRARWIPQLLKYVPRNSLPHWYGGPKNFLPLKVYG